MSIDEAITHCLEVADGQTVQGKCPECAEEHRQLAEWLTDYKRLKERESWKDEYIKYIKVPKKALKYRTAGMVAYNAEWLKNHFDIERTVICGAQQSCCDCVSRQAVLGAIDAEAWAFCDYLIRENRNDEQKPVSLFSDNLRDRISNDLPSVTPTQEPCEDCISRQAVLGLAYDMSEIDGEHFTEPCLVVDVEDIKKLPPVNPQPKTGWWMYDKNIENWRCSECGETPKTIGYCGTADFMAEHFKYCNHCGIRMIEPQEGSGEE